MENLEKRIAALELKAEGKCPSCLQEIKGWIIPTGSFAPEMWASYRERGIDPANGHLFNCPDQSLKL